MGTAYDLAVLGGGPGGYVAAIKAAQLGLAVCLVEKESLGGVCLNWGCIPSKSLIHSATAFAALPRMESFGVRVDRSGLRYADVQETSRAAARTLATGVAGLLRKNKVDVRTATGRLESAREIRLSGGEHDGVTIRADNVILATGSRPTVVPGFEFDEEQVLSSTGLLALRELPASLLIIGGGAVGCEFAYAMNAFGVRVTLLEMAPRLLPQADHEAADLFASSLRRSGIDIRTGVRAQRLRRTDQGVAVELDDAGAVVTAEKVLAAFGRSPNSADLGLGKLGVELDPRGRVVTGAYGETRVRGLYAVGDVGTGPGLAHTASKEAVIAVGRIAGRPQQERLDEELVPSVVYGEPQVAGFGLTEAQCEERRPGFRKSVFPLRATGKAVAVESTEGFVKILADGRTGEILGAHVVGAGASELIHELLLAKSSELVVEDIESTVHAHPTLSEAIMESAHGVFGHPVHL